MKAKATIVIKADDDEVQDIMDALHISTAEEVKVALRLIYMQAAAGNEQNTDITVEVKE